MALAPVSTKVNLDNQSDDPRQARAELDDLVDNVNTINNSLGPAATLGAGEGLVVDGTNLKVQIATTDNITIDLGAY